MTLIEYVGYLLLTAYLLVFFGLTAAAAQRAKRSVWLFGAATPGQRLPATLFQLGFIGAALWPLARAGFALSGAESAAHVIFGRNVLDIVGCLLIGIGVCIAGLAQAQMGASWRIGAAKGQSGALVAKGLFRLSRNPVFLGQIILFVGLFVMFPDVLQGGLTIAIVAAARLQVVIEEQELAVSLGEPYFDYQRRVRRWFGAG